MNPIPKTAQSPFVILVDDNFSDAHISIIAIKEAYPLAHVLHFEGGASMISYGKNLGKEEAVPDMILIDLNMPLMDGIELLEALQADARISKVPKFIYSGIIDPTERALALQAGGDGFFEKPPDFTATVQFFEQILQPILTARI